ncbi:cytochrome P460 family protein [Vibrio jasicida]|nr:cytochrome P460 family protein [Vibrio jasicida]
MKKHIIIPLLSILTLSNIGIAYSDINKPNYTEDGQVIRPSDWETWVFVGAPLTPNALNNGNATFKEFHNVYIEPSAFDYYKKTGKFANGTQLVKARTALYEGESCRSVSKENGSCQAVSGRGYFEGEYTGFELTVKDTERFSKDPGGWVYYSFGEERPWKDSAKPFPAAACNSCHSFQADDDFVFTQFYPVLRDNDPKKKHLNKEK